MSETLPETALSSHRQERAMVLQVAGGSAEESEGISPGPETDPPVTLDLLVPKLQFPRLPSSLVVRQRLLTQIDAGLERKLTLLSAPAGLGKTTVVSQWLADCREHGQASPVAWLWLDENDNDPIRFWRYIMMACQIFQTTSSQSALAPTMPWISISVQLVIMSGVRHEERRLRQESSFEGSTLCDRRGDSSSSFLWS